MLAAIGEVVTGILESPIVTGALIALGVGIVVLWLAAAWWAYLDVSRRTSAQLARLGAVAMILLSTPALLPFSLITYLLVRPQMTVAEGRALRLLAGLHPAIAGDLGCYSCGTVVDPEWRRCPACAGWLASPCEACEEWSELDAEICPWCAAGKRAGWLPDYVDEPAVAVAPAATAGAYLAWAGSAPAAVGVRPPASFDARPTLAFDAASLAAAGPELQRQEGIEAQAGSGTGVDVPGPTHITLSSGRTLPARAASRRRRGGAPAPARLRRTGVGARSEGPLGV